MRKILIMAALFAAIGMTPASAQHVRSPGLWTDALLTARGRASICRHRLEAAGHPYPSLLGKRGRGIVSACSRELWRQHREAIRAYYRRSS
jgi:hypothetical protein